MKKFVIALTALGALTAAPAMARSDTHVSFGFYSPAPIYYEPPVVYYPPVARVYYAPAPYYGYHRRHGHGWGHGRRFESAWNDRNDYRGGYDRGRGGRH